MNNKIVFFDLETTGLDVAADRIVSYSFREVSWPELTEGRQLKALVNPGKPISDEAAAIHGITNDMLTYSDPFKDHAGDIKEMITGAVLAGYNVERFDVVMLAEEFNRCDIDLADFIEGVVDVYTIFKKHTPHDLASALKFYCRKDIQGAHDADADVKATIEVFHEQLKTPWLADQIDPTQIEQIIEFTSSDRVDFAGKLARDEQGHVVYNIGKSKGKRVIDDPGFGEWLIKQSWCTENTRNVIRKLLNLEMR